MGPDRVGNGDAYVETGITHLIFRSSGPDYDLEPLEKLIAWRDEYRERATESASPT